MSLPIRMFARPLLACLALTASVAASADPIRGLYATGVDEAGNDTAPGAPDVHYNVEGHAAATYRHPSYYRTFEGQWIASRPDGGYATPPTPDSGGPTTSRASITYTLSFNLGDLDPRSARIVGSFAADDSAELRINGKPVTQTANGFFGPTVFTIASGFRAGTNTLTFVVTDYGAPSGLIVHGMSGTAEPVPAVGWRTDAWSDWSSTCGSATRHRRVACIDSFDGDEVDDARCTATRPEVSETSDQTHGCGFEWTPSAWSTPAPSCGQVARARTIACTRSDNRTVDDSFCSEVPRPVQTDEVIDLSTCSYAWTVGPWGPPSTTCGRGTETRTTSCRRSDGSAAEGERCTGVGPETSRSSEFVSGCSYSWQRAGTGAWSPCANSSQSRAIDLACLRSDGTVAGEAQCPDPKPITFESRSCTETPDPAGLPSEGDVVVFRRTLGIPPRR